MIRAALTSALLLCVPLAVAAQQVTPIVGSAMIDPSSAAIDAFGVAMDTDGDSRISDLELDIASDQIFLSVDADGSGRISKREMIDWPFGLGDLARFRGREVEFALAMNTVFDLMDTDRDMEIGPEEHAAGLALASRLADRDRDGRLSLTEFREDFLIMTALRRGVGSATVR